MKILSPQQKNFYDRCHHKNFLRGHRFIRISLAVIKNDSTFGKNSVDADINVSNLHDIKQAQFWNIFNSYFVDIFSFVMVNEATA